MTMAGKWRENGGTSVADEKPRPTDRWRQQLWLFNFACAIQLNSTRWITIQFNLIDLELNYTSNQVDQVQMTPDFLDFSTRLIL